MNSEQNAPYQFRLNKEDLDKIKKIARASGLPLSVYFRLMIKKIIRNPIKIDELIAS